MKKDRPLPAPPLLSKREFAAAFRLTERTLTSMIKDGLPIASGEGTTKSPYQIDLYPAVLWMLNREAVKQKGKRVFTGFIYER
ncbi:hypothetical protein, partial [Vibrio sp. 10N.222.55.E7]